MEIVGKITKIESSTDNSIFLTLELPSKNKALQLYDKYKNINKLRIEMKQFREKRSIDANAYAWALMSQLAGVQQTDKESIYELMLERYGQPYINENGSTIKISVLEEIDVSKYGIHTKYIGQGHIGDKVFSHYIVLKGSSEYDSKEMSTFIDGIVYECKEHGIETLTPRELEQMKLDWKQQKNKKSRAVYELSE